MKNYYKRKDFWEAWLVVGWAKFCGQPEWTYGWWKSRLSLIKRGEI